MAVWADDDVAPVSQEVRERVLAIAKTVEDAGGSVDFDARPDFDSSEAHDIFQTLLWSAMAARIPDADFAEMVKDAAALDPSDRSGGAMVLRTQTMTHHDHYTAHNKRMILRWAWDAFFKEYDAVIAPIMATRPSGTTTGRWGSARSRSMGPSVLISSSSSGPASRSAAICRPPLSRQVPTATVCQSASRSLAASLAIWRRSDLPSYSKTKATRSRRPRATRDLNASPEYRSYARRTAAAPAPARAHTVVLPRCAGDDGAVCTVGLDWRAGGQP